MVFATILVMDIHHESAEFISQRLPPGEQCLGDGLRILARIIVQAHVGNQANQNTFKPDNSHNETGNGEFNEDLP